MNITYTPSFVRQFKKFVPALQDEVIEKIELFKKDQNHSFLKTHKLKGRMKGKWSFSVNYAYRIVFEYDNKESIALLAVGDHAIYSCT